MKKQKVKKIEITIEFPLTPTAVKKLKQFLKDIDLVSRHKCKYCGGKLDESDWKYAVCIKCGKKQ